MNALHIVPQNLTEDGAELDRNQLKVHQLSNRPDLQHAASRSGGVSRKRRDRMLNFSCEKTRVEAKQASKHERENKRRGADFTLDGPGRRGPNKTKCWGERKGGGWSQPRAKRSQSHQAGINLGKKKRATFSAPDARVFGGGCASASEKTLSPTLKDRFLAAPHPTGSEKNLKRDRFSSASPFQAQASEARPKNPSRNGAEHLPIDGYSIRTSSIQSVWTPARLVRAQRGDLTPEKSTLFTVCTSAGLP